MFTNNRSTECQFEVQFKSLDVPKELSSLAADAVLYRACGDAWCLRDKNRGEHLVDVQQALLGNMQNFNIVDGCAVHKDGSFLKFHSVKALSKVSCTRES